MALRALVQVGIATSRPPREHVTVAWAVTAETEAAAMLAATHLAMATVPGAVMPVMAAILELEL
jgi:hypothetical protein